MKFSKFQILKHAKVNIGYDRFAILPTLFTVLSGPPRIGWPINIAQTKIVL